MFVEDGICNIKIDLNNYQNFKIKVYCRLIIEY